jgi:hypothetical protein
VEIVRVENRWLRTDVPTIDCAPAAVPGLTLKLCCACNSVQGATAMTAFLATLAF